MVFGDYLSYLVGVGVDKKFPTAVSPCFSPCNFLMLWVSCSLPSG